MNDFIIAIIGIIFLLSPFVLIVLIILHFIKRNKNRKPVVIKQNRVKFIIEDNSEIKDNTPDTESKNFINEPNLPNEPDELDEVIKSRIISKYSDGSEQIKNVIKSAIFVVENQQVSSPMLQRYLMVGYNTAGAIFDVLESMAIIGGFNGAKPREALIPDLKSLEKYLDDYTITDSSIISYGYFDSTYYNEQNAIEKGWNPEDESLDDWQKKQEIRNKILQQQKDKALQRKIRQEMVDEGLIEKVHTKRRERISQETKDIVWNRDGGKCVECGNNEKLEFDHIVPFSKGGSNTYRNIQLLCENCNRKKSNKIG